MNTCSVLRSGAIELFFYDELDGRRRAFVERHLTTCAECREAFEDLSVIREALAARPDVSDPPGGDWTAFMARLDEAILVEMHPRETAEGVRFRTSSASTRYATYLAMAALLTLVTLSVAYVGRSPDVTRMSERPVSSDETQRAATGAAWSSDAAFASLSEQHFDRSKLVVLGLANKDPRESGPDDWAYERQLASTLLTDTRLYRLAAEERGMRNIARVMGDLEIVLLQTSMSEKPDPDALAQIQRLIHKRDLVTKMQVVKTVAGL